MDFSELKKEISVFLSSEEAKILMKDAAKIGLSAMVISGIMAQTLSESNAQTHVNDHGSGFGDDDDDGHDDHSDHDQHTSHADHNDASLGCVQGRYDAGDLRGGIHSNLSSPLHSDCFCEESH